MSTNFKVEPHLPLAILVHAGCKLEKTGPPVQSSDTYFPIKMPDNHYVWVCLHNERVHEFVRFGGNNPDWMINFCQSHSRKVVSEHEEEYWQ